MTESEKWRAKAGNWVAPACIGGHPKLAQYLIDVAAEATELACEQPFSQTGQAHLLTAVKGCADADEHALKLYGRPQGRRPRA